MVNIMLQQHVIQHIYRSSERMDGWEAEWGGGGLLSDQYAKWELI